jgi:hypothetical protein
MKNVTRSTKATAGLAGSFCFLCDENVAGEGDDRYHLKVLTTGAGGYHLKVLTTGAGGGLSLESVND